MEKPIADTLADGKVVQEVCEQAGVVLMVGHCFRRLGAARMTKQLIEEGALGEVVLAEANFSLPAQLTPDKWRYCRETCPGGPLMQLGVHHADTLQYWLGPIRRVQGSFARLVTEELEEFAQCARGESEPETGAREGFTALAVIRGAIASHETGVTQLLEVSTDA